MSINKIGQHTNKLHVFPRSEFIIDHSCPCIIESTRHYAGVSFLKDKLQIYFR